MTRKASPLRYPGGKASLYPLVWPILKLNRLARRHYVEPYAGGCGLALSLLYGAHVSDIHINDIDPSIWAFWHSVLENTDEFASLIRTAPLTIDEWHRQREVHSRNDDSNPLALGFAAFFLNRTNRSGIVSGASVIGGLDQSGAYKLDCRFNREDLERRVRRVAKYRSRIHLTCQDALKFIEDRSERLPESAFFCIDPPYFEKGKSLYANFYNPEDHGRLARRILALPNPWIVTYDNAPPIAALYKSRRQYRIDINYSLARKRRGVEIMIASKGLAMPSSIRERQTN